MVLILHCFYNVKKYSQYYLRAKLQKFVNKIILIFKTIGPIFLHIFFTNEIVPNEMSVLLFSFKISGWTKNKQGKVLGILFQYIHWIYRQKFQKRCVLRHCLYLHNFINIVLSKDIFSEPCTFDEFIFVMLIIRNFFKFLCFSQWVFDKTYVDSDKSVGFGFDCCLTISEEEYLVTIIWRMNQSIVTILIRSILLVNQYSSPLIDKSIFINFNFFTFQCNY